MHIFLTGPHDIGKTTIINKITNDFPENINVGGFRTFKGVDFAPGKNYVLMESTSNNIIVAPFPVALRDKTEKGFQAYPEEFDTKGVGILDSSCGCDLIIMDELGFMESNAHKFQDKIIEILDGDIPVLGTVKLDKSPFLDQVREHPKVKVIEVTIQNRDKIFKETAEEVSWLLRGQKKK